ncbi:MAG: hypothetical protein AAGA68_09020 [Pseudomonadota bacterium]
MNRYGIAASAGIAALALSTSAAFAAEPVTGDLRMSSRHAHTGALKIQDLQALQGPQRSGGAPASVPNQLGKTTFSRQLTDLVQDALVDPAHNPVLAPALSLSFDGPSSDDNSALFGFRIQPPDTNGDVGRDFAVSYINLTWSYYDKAGNIVGGPFAGNSFWAGFGGPCEANNNGDPIIIYDEDVGRWVFNQFAPFQGVQCFAISDGEDPAGPYTLYEFVVEPNAFNDYPKVGVWASEDGTQSAYTYTGRNFTPQGNPFAARDITAVLFDRDAMLAGAAAGFTTTVMPGGFFTYDGAQPGSVQALSNAPGGACPLFSVAEAPATYRFFEFCENFPGAGTFTTLPTVSVPAFDDNLGDVPQPGGDNLDTLAFFTMYRANHAVIDGQHQLALAHTVDAGGDRGGMRWAILDVDDYNNISLIDTGTQAPNDGFERWMGSVALDTVGNLGLAYTRGGNGDFTSVYVTGRETTDPAGTVQQEVECVAGTGAQTGGGGRWGDYSSTSLDPSDGCTFWTFQEYVAETGSFEWNTRVCAWNFPSCTGVQPTDFTLAPADPGIAGVANDFNTSNGSANSGVVLYIGSSAGSSAISLGNCTTTVDLTNARLIGFARADGAGNATITRNIPGQAAGRTILAQAVDLSACETSNVASQTF